MVESDNGMPQRESWRSRRRDIYRVDPQKIIDLESNPPKRIIDELEENYGELPLPTKLGLGWKPYRSEKDISHIQQLESLQIPPVKTPFEELEEKHAQEYADLDSEEKDFEQREQEAVQGYLNAFLHASAHNSTFSDNLSLGILGSTLPGEGIAHSEGKNINPIGNPEAITLNIIHMTPDGYSQLAAQTRITILDWDGGIPLAYQKNDVDFTGTLFPSTRLVGIMERVTEHLIDPTGMGIDKK
jgi:hypothetical protein